MESISKRSVVGTAAGAIITMGGFGSFVAACLASKIPVIKSMNSKALTAVRLTSSYVGGAATLAGTILFGKCVSHVKRGRGEEDGQEDLWNDEDMYIQESAT